MASDSQIFNGPVNPTLPTHRPQRVWHTPRCAKVQCSLEVALTWHKIMQIQVSLHLFISLGSTEPLRAGTVADVGAMFGQG